VSCRKTPCRWSLWPGAPQGGDEIQGEKRTQDQESDRNIAHDGAGVVAEYPTLDGSAAAVIAALVKRASLPVTTCARIEKSSHVAVFPTPLRRADYRGKECTWL
jgi:hypothetical protein